MRRDREVEPADPGGPVGDIVGDVRADSVGVTRIPQQRVEWLTGEVERWRRRGLIDSEAAEAITAGYAPTDASRKVTATLTMLGMALVAFGVIWLGAANYSDVPPSARLAIAIALWLGAVAGARLAVERSAPSWVVVPAHACAAAIFGGVVFQVAQYLNDPIQSYGILLAWSAGVIPYALATESGAALLIGVGPATAWWQLRFTSNIEEVVLVFVALAAVMAAMATFADRQARTLARTLRATAIASILLALMILLSADLTHSVELSNSVAIWLGVAIAALAMAATRSSRADRWELLGIGLACAAAVILTIVHPTIRRGVTGQFDMDDISVVYTVAVHSTIMAVMVGGAIVARVHDHAGVAIIAVAGLAILWFTTATEIAGGLDLTVAGLMFLGSGVVALAVGREVARHAGLAAKARESSS